MGKRRKIMGLSRSKHLKFMIYIKEMSKKIMGLCRSKGLNLYQIIWEKEKKIMGLSQSKHLKYLIYKGNQQKNHGFGTK